MTSEPPAPADPGAPGPIVHASSRVQGWAEHHWARALEFFEQQAVDFLMRRLDEERADYDLRVPNNMANFMAVARAGDVVLVEGRRRISFVIQKITSSPWSHATLYVGKGQILEAEDHGVVLSPVMKYAQHNIRLCVPRFIDGPDRGTVVAMARRALGRSYDVTNIRNLLLSYFRRQRNPMDFIGNLEECQEMCSGLLARVFDSVGHPVLPGRNPSQIAPRDFDLSPNFAIVKFNDLRETRHTGTATVC